MLGGVGGGVGYREVVVHAGIEGGINIGGEEHCLWDGGPEAAQSVVLARTSKYFQKMSKMINMPFHVLQD